MSTLQDQDQVATSHGASESPEPSDARAMRWIILVAAVTGTTLTTVVDLLWGPTPWSALDGGWLALLFFIARRVFPAGPGDARVGPADR
jgi:hypothetical protein